MSMPILIQNLPVMNCGMNPIQIVHTLNRVRIMNNNSNPVQLTRTVCSPTQIASSAFDQVQVALDPVKSLELSSAPVLPASSAPFTLHLTCEDISECHSEDALLETAKKGLTIYACCEKCKGLWKEKSFPTDHLLTCCGTIEASSADLFAIKRALLLVLLTHSGCLRNPTEKGLLDSSGHLETLCEADISYHSEYHSFSKLPSLTNQTTVCSREGRVSDLEDPSEKEGLVSIKIPHLSSSSPSGRDVNTKEIFSVSSTHFSDSDLEGDLKKDSVSVDTENAAEPALVVLSQHTKSKPLPASDGGNPTSIHMLDTSATDILDAAFRKMDDSVEGIREERQIKYSSFLVDMCHKGKREMRYQCASCSFSTRMVGFFDRHMRSCHNGHLTCDVCSLSFESRSRFRKHMNMHIRPFMCEFCSQCFAEKREMEKHAWIHKEFLPFQCSQCDYRCRYKRLLQEHSRKHTGDVLECKEPSCGFTTCYRWALENHRTVKHSSCRRIFTCDSCDYRTNYRGSLKKHQKLHQGRGDYVCSLCPFQAVVRHDFVRHLRKHTSEKIFFCNICSYSTVYSSSLHVHLMHHLQLKPWKCGNCEYKAVTKQKVSRHMQNVHPFSDFIPVNTGLKFYCNAKAFRGRGSGELVLKKSCLTAANEMISL